MHFTVYEKLEFPKWLSLLYTCTLYTPHVGWLFSSNPTTSNGMSSILEAVWQSDYRSHGGRREEDCLASSEAEEEEEDTHTHTRTRGSQHSSCRGLLKEGGSTEVLPPPPPHHTGELSDRPILIITATRKILQYSAVQYCGSKRLTHMMSTQQKSLPTLNVMSTHVLMTPVVMYLISVCPNRVRYPLPKISK